MGEAASWVHGAVVHERLQSRIRGAVRCRPLAQAGLCGPLHRIRVRFVIRLDDVATSGLFLSIRCLVSSHLRMNLWSSSTCTIWLMVVAIGVSALVLAIRYIPRTIEL